MTLRRKNGQSLLIAMAQSPGRTTSNFVYLVQPTELVRISLPVGKMERVSSEEYNPGLGPVRLGYCPTILRCSAVDRSTQEIYTLDLQYRLPVNCRCNCEQIRKSQPRKSEPMGLPAKGPALTAP